MTVVNGDLEVKGNLNALRSISVVGNTVGNISAGPGSLVLAGGSNVTLSGSTAPNAMTLSINANAGTAAGGFGHFAYTNFPRVTMGNILNLTAINGIPIFVPFNLDYTLTQNQLMYEMSRAANNSNSFTVQAGIYTFNNSTQLSLLGSLQNTYSNSASGSVNGVRAFIATGWETQVTTLNPGAYALMMYFTCNNTTAMNYSIRGGTTLTLSGLVLPGTNSVVTATSDLTSVPLGVPFLGRYSTTTNAILNTVGFSELAQFTTMQHLWFGLWKT